MQLSRLNLPRWIQRIEAVGISTVMHSLALAALWFIPIAVLDRPEEVVLESIVTEERDLQDIEQVLEVDNIASDQLQPTAGSAAASELAVPSAAAASLAPQTVIEESPDDEGEPVFQFDTGSVALIGDDEIGVDLGVGSVKGETGAVVGSVGAAMSRVSLEILRIAREKPVHVVWLFDESSSMRDEQQGIRDKFAKIYEEVGMASEQSKSPRDRKKNKQTATIVTSIVGFGEGIHPLTPRPTTDIQQIRKAISQIPVDESGSENFCRAIMTAIDQYLPASLRSQRKLMLVVVTDESGDDGKLVEETVSKAKRSQCPVYFIAREAIFGYPYARVTWVDPVYNLTHWLNINRGPETAFPEALQWDGLHARWDSHSSGFGPYEQVRIARESGGVFFMLPEKDANLAGIEANDQRVFDYLDMKEYQPLLLSRPEYLAERDKSPFRKTLWEVILRLNPHLDPELNIRQLYYSIQPEEFRVEGQESFQKAVRALRLTKQAVELLEQIEPLRSQEASQRWRAAYDLSYAQCLSYRVRLFQFLLALDRHVSNPPQIKDKKTNRWNVDRRKEMLPPNDEQIRLSGVSWETLVAQEKLSREKFLFVTNEHPRTPWAKRARYDLDKGFGMEFKEHFRDPNYEKVGTGKIKIPKQ